MSTHWVKADMTLHLAFQEAMAEALSEYHDAKVDVMSAMKKGDIDGPIWIMRKDRLERRWMHGLLCPGSTLASRGRDSQSLFSCPVYRSLTRVAMGRFLPIAIGCNRP